MKKDYAKTADTLIAALFLCERQIEDQRERDLKAF